MTKKILVILGSVRTARAGKAVADWVMNQTEKFTDKLEFELIDLKEINLPFMDEPVSPMSSNDYVNEHTKKWSKIIDAADGFVFITPEYNHGVSPVLKNALDFLFQEWKDKPVAFVGYGGSGARESIRQLKEVIVFMGMKPLEDQVGIGKIWEAVDPDGNIAEEHLQGDILDLFKQLEKVL